MCMCNSSMAPACRYALPLRGSRCGQPRKRKVGAARCAEFGLPIWHRPSRTLRRDADDDPQEHQDTRTPHRPTAGRAGHVRRNGRRAFQLAGVGRRVSPLLVQQSDAHRCAGLARHPRRRVPHLAAAGPSGPEGREGDQNLGYPPRSSRKPIRRGRRGLGAPVPGAVRVRPVIWRSGGALLCFEVSVRVVVPTRAAVAGGRPVRGWVRGGCLRHRRRCPSGGRIGRGCFPSPSRAWGGRGRYRVR